MSDLISRQAAIDIERNATVDTNPSHFEAHQKFTQFMDDAEISSFGRWQWSNGFNTALTAVGIDLKKLPSAQPERIRGRWSGFYSEPNDDTHIYGEKLMEGDTVYLLGVEGYVSCECGAWGWGSPNYVPWEQLVSRMPHNNAPTFCYCDNFISFWELKWNFDDGNDWDGVPYIKHCPNCGADMRETNGSED